MKLDNKTKAKIDAYFENITEEQISRILYKIEEYKKLMEKYQE